VKCNDRDGEVNESEDVRAGVGGTGKSGKCAITDDTCNLIARLTGGQSRLPWWDHEEDEALAGAGGWQGRKMGHFVRPLPSIQAGKDGIHKQCCPVRIRGAGSDRYKTEQEVVGRGVRIAVEGCTEWGML